MCFSTSAETPNAACALGGSNKEGERPGRPHLFQHKRHPDCDTSMRYFRAMSDLSGLADLFSNKIRRDTWYIARKQLFFRKAFRSGVFSLSTGFWKPSVAEFIIVSPAESLTPVWLGSSYTSELSLTAAPLRSATKRSNRRPAIKDAKTKIIWYFAKFSTLVNHLYSCESPLNIFSWFTRVIDIVALKSPFLMSSGQRQDGVPSPRRINSLPDVRAESHLLPEVWWANEIVWLGGRNQPEGRTHPGWQRFVKWCFSHLFP